MLFVQPMIFGIDVTGVIVLFCFFINNLSLTTYHYKKSPFRQKGQRKFVSFALLSVAKNQ
jgi:hypothetical protein